MHGSGFKVVPIAAVITEEAIVASTQAPTRFSHAVFFAFPAIWEPGIGWL